VILEITRPSDDELYSVSVSYGAGTRPGVSRHQLTEWLHEIGASEADIGNVLAIGPNQTIAIEVPDDSWHGFAAAG
jgi:hypothetical protein